MIQGSKIDVILRSSLKTSFVTFLRDMSGKDWNPSDRWNIQCNVMTERKGRRFSAIV